MADAPADPAPSKHEPTGYRTTPHDTDGMPSGIPYIIGNEAAERFSFYGMKGILVVFMTKFLVDAAGQPDTMTEEDAKSVYHLFTASVYFFPLLGAILADTVLGKYRTIVWLSVVYCLGHGVLALMDLPHVTHIQPRIALYVGLFLIAVGSGGIKPCVSAHVGDQFGSRNAHLISKVFGWFYISINLGAFASTLLTPVLLNHPDYGPAYAFGIPGALMAIATLLFWLGRHRYAHVPANPSGVAETLSDTNGLLAIARLLPVFGFITAFWMLFDQTGGEWVLQGERMEQRIGETTATLELNREAIQIEAEAGDVSFDEQVATALREKAAAYDIKLTGEEVAAFAAELKTGDDPAYAIERDGYTKILPSQMQSANPFLILTLVPLFSYVIFPIVGRFVEVTPLRKIGFGIALAGVAFFITGVFERLIAAGSPLHILWQLLPYTVLTAAEVLVSITSLEFAYTQAPKALKSIIMGIYLLSISLANFVVAGVNAMIGAARESGNEDFLSGASYHDAFGLVAIVAALGFAVWSRSYRYQTILQDDEPAMPPVDPT